MDNNENENRVIAWTMLKGALYRVRIHGICFAFDTYWDGYHNFQNAY